MSKSDFITTAELVSGEKNKEERIRKFTSGEPVDIKACIKKNRHDRIAEASSRVSQKGDCATITINNI